MAVQKEWTCLAHGAFDSSESVCPHGCGEGMVERAFRTAPTIQSRSFRGINNTFETLARENGLSNMRNAEGQGMRKADAQTYQRLNEATALVMGSSKAGMAGMDAGEFFKPLNQFQPGSTGDGGVLQRQGNQVLSGAIPLNMPAPQLEAAPFDGKSLGLPPGDAQ